MVGRVGCKTTEQGETGRRVEEEGRGRRMEGKEWRREGRKEEGEEWREGIGDGEGRE